MENNFYIATTYSSGVYGAGPYGGTTTSSSGSGSSSSSGSNLSTSSGSLLTNTGFDIALIVTLASVITLAAVLIRFWKRPASNKTT